MLKRQFLVRYLSYSLGTLLTVINLLLITYYLNIFQFAVWGVANSLIYIFSQLSQLTYVQYVEKYFPNLNPKSFPASYIYNGKSYMDFLDKNDFDSCDNLESLIKLIDIKLKKSGG